MKNGWLEFMSNQENENKGVMNDDKKNPFWICDLSSFNSIKLLGNKSAEFLQGQVTCDVNQVNKTQCTLGSLCEYKGRVYAIFYLFHWQDNYYLWMPHDIIDNTITQLNKYAVFSKVTLQNQTHELVSIGIGGTQCEQYLSTFMKDIPKSINECIQTEHAILIKISDLPKRYIIIGEISELQNFWTLFKAQAMVAATNFWELNNISADIPMIHSETINLFTPHQLNLPTLNAVSFNKGCYTGQEIVARTQYLGKLKQHLYHATVNISVQPYPGEKVFISIENNEIQEAGTIVNSALNDPDQFHLLAVLQDNTLELSPFILQQNNKYYLQNIVR